MENTPVVDEVVVPKKNILFEVTPASRVLAGVLFIALPFIGGWIGYTYGSNNSITEVTTNIHPDTPVQIATPQSNSEISTASEEIQHNLAEDFSTEEMACSALPEIENILNTFDPDSEKFWRRLVFEINDAGCTKRVFENENVLYSISAGCGYCLKQIYKNESEYKTLHSFSKLFDNQIVTVNERSVEVLDPITSQSSTILQLDERDAGKTFFAGEDQSSKITYNDTDGTISVSVFDVNTCEVGHGGCYYTEIPSDLKIVTLR